MLKWEYIELRHKATLRSWKWDDKYKYSEQQEVCDRINQFGQEGWEMVAETGYQEAASTLAFYYLLKRRIPE